jgi:hypothetical protein
MRGPLPSAQSKTRGGNAVGEIWPISYTNTRSTSEFISKSGLMLRNPASWTSVRPELYKNTRSFLDLFKIHLGSRCGGNLAHFVHSLRGTTPRPSPICWIESARCFHLVTNSATRFRLCRWERAAEWFLARNASNARLGLKRALEAILWRNQCAALSHLHNRKRVAEFVTTKCAKFPPQREPKCILNKSRKDLVFLYNSGPTDVQLAGFLSINPDLLMNSEVDLVFVYEMCQISPTA